MILKCVGMLPDATVDRVVKAKRTRFRERGVEGRGEACYPTLGTSFGLFYSELSRR